MWIKQLAHDEMIRKEQQYGCLKFETGSSLRDGLADLESIYKFIINYGKQNKEKTNPRRG